MLLTIALILLVLAVLLGGFNHDLLWLALVVIVIALVLGAFGFAH